MRDMDVKLVTALSEKDQQNSDPQPNINTRQAEVNDTKRRTKK